MDTKRQQYRTAVNQMGKKEYTLMKMQEYGFWPEHLPTPYERQRNETPEEYQERQELLKEYQQLAKQIAQLYEEKAEINTKLRQLQKEYDQTWDYDQIRKDVAQKIMRESIERRAARKRQRELEKEQVTEAWNQKKQAEILFIGTGYSGFLSHRENSIEKLSLLGMPIILDDKTLAGVLGIEYQQLRFLAYHRDVVKTDHYHRYTIAKRNGGERSIAAPKPLLKNVQKKILELILERVGVSDYAHGFLKNRSVVSGASVHNQQPDLLINMDIESFFPTITYERVRGMFHSFGYSGHLSSILAMLCTDCDRMEIEIKGEKRYVKTSSRRLPQGSPASPMITNIICRTLDQKLIELADQYQAQYSRYADDLSFSFQQQPEPDQIRKFMSRACSVIKAEGFTVNKEKTRYLRKNNRQCVTGVVINGAEIGVPKVWVKRMRAAIYNAKKMSGKQALPNELRNEISGMAAWLKTVNEARYKAIITEAEMLLKETKNS